MISGDILRVGFTMNNYPYESNLINQYRSNQNPSEIHAQSAYLTRFFEKYLIEKAMSTIVWEGLPEHWEYNYFIYTLYLGGYLGIFDTDAYGVIPQWGSLAGDIDIWLQPKEFIPASVKESWSGKRFVLGRDCEILRLQPNYSGIWDIISTYSNILALSYESAGINLLNSKIGYIFAAESQNVAESYKKMMDDLLSGRPAAVVSRKLFRDDGKLAYDVLVNDLNKIYIQSEILSDMAAWDARFNAEIGIPNTNIQKKSGISPEEVSANNADTRAKAEIWLEQINRDLEKINNHFELQITARLRYGGGNYGNMGDSINLGTL